MFFIILAGLLVLTESLTCGGNVYCVGPGDYNTIQEAVNAVSSGGDIIAIKQTTIRESVNLNRDVGTLDAPVFIIPFNTDTVTIEDDGADVFIVTLGGWSIRSEDGSLTIDLRSDVRVVTTTSFGGYFSLSDTDIDLSVANTGRLFYLSYACSVERVILENIIITANSNGYRALEIRADEMCYIPQDMILITGNEFNDVTNQLFYANIATDVRFTKNFVQSTGWTGDLFSLANDFSRLYFSNNIFEISNFGGDVIYFNQPQNAGYTKQVFVQNNLFSCSNPNGNRVLYLDVTSGIGDFNYEVVHFQNNLMLGTCAEGSIYSMDDGSLGIGDAVDCVYRYNYVEDNNVPFTVSSNVIDGGNNVIGSPVPIHGTGNVPSPYYKQTYTSGFLMDGLQNAPYSPPDDYEGTKREIGKTFLAGPFQTMVCLNAFFDETNFCAICHGNRNATLECLECNEGWDISTGCDHCLGNRDIDTNCLECLHYYSNEQNDDCMLCPGNFDASTNCTTCEYPYDIDTDCNACVEATGCVCTIPKQTTVSLCQACENHWTNYPYCDVCPGNMDPTTGCVECVAPWVNPSANCMMCETGLDVHSNCTECIGNYQLPSCSVCVGSNYDVSNDCETCVNYYSLESGCSDCLNHFSSTSQCTQCDGNWDVAQYCAKCVNNWLVETNCTVCREGFDPATDCGSCFDKLTGEKCDKPLCFGEASDSPDACGSIGECCDIDHCTCYSNITRIFGFECGEKIEIVAELVVEMRQIRFKHKFDIAYFEMDEYSSFQDEFECSSLVASANNPECVALSKCKFEDDGKLTTLMKLDYSACGNVDDAFIDAEGLHTSAVTQHSNQVEYGNIDITLLRVYISEPEIDKTRIFIILGVIGGVVVLIIIIVVICVSVLCTVICYNDYKRKKLTKLLSEVGEEELDILQSENNPDFESGLVPKMTLKRDMFKVEYRDLDILEQIGQGGSGALIFRCNWKNSVVAFKCWRVDMFKRDRDMKRFEREVNIALNLSHPNIMQTYGCVHKPPRMGLIMEYCTNGALSNYIENMSDDIGMVEKLSNCVKVRLLHELIAGIVFLHGKNIIHRDIKPDNALLDAEMHLKLIDFGISKIMEESNNVQTRRIGTSYFMAPEVWDGKDYDLKADVFSFGVTVYALICETNSPYGEQAKNVEVKVSTNEDFRPFVHPPEFKPFTGLEDFMKRCWLADPKKRPSSKECLQFFVKLRENFKDEEQPKKPKPKEQNVRIRREEMKPPVKKKAPPKKKLSGRKKAPPRPQSITGGNKRAPSPPKSRKHVKELK